MLLLRPTLCDTKLVPVVLGTETVGVSDRAIPKRQQLIQNVRLRETLEV